MRWLAVLAVAAACGDNVHVDDNVSPKSGTRLRLEWIQYDDGTRQPNPDGFYDVDLHARCTPTPWIDGTVRCIPAAERAVYLDADCTLPVGRAREIQHPTHFIGDVRGTGKDVRTLYPSGAAIDVTRVFDLVAGQCRAQSIDFDDLYFVLGDPVTDLVEIRDGELDPIGDERIALRSRETSDGARVFTGLRDRVHDLRCVLDGSVCAPIESRLATGFRDPECLEPAIAVGQNDAVVVARIVEPTGCPSYHAIGEPTILYRRDGNVCIRETGLRGFALGAPLDLPVVESTIEDLDGRRLQRVLATDGELRFYADDLYDGATRSACVRHEYEKDSRCLPSNAIRATTLYAAGCAFGFPVAVLPPQTCERIAFATTGDGVELAVHAIGAPIETPLFDFTIAGCVPFDGVARALGPALPPETFARGVLFGER